MFDLAKPYFAPPFRYEPEGQKIFDSAGTLVVDVRAWGHLTGQGAHALPHDKAAEIQDQTGEHLAKLMNRHWQPVQVVVHDTVSEGLKPLLDQPLVGHDEETRRWAEFGRAAFAACARLDRAVPLEGMDNAQRIRWAADEILRLRAAPTERKYAVARAALEWVATNSDSREVCTAVMNALRECAQIHSDAISSQKLASICDKNGLTPAELHEHNEAQRQATNPRQF